jgi:hypothetical protein
MTDATLKAQLQPIADSYCRFQLWRGLTLCWAWAAAACVVLLLLYAATRLWFPVATPLLLGATLIAAAVVWTRSRRLAPAYRWIARQIEQQNPRLDTVLLAAVEQQPDAATGDFNYLQQRVILEALEQNQKQPWLQRQLERAFFAQCTQFATLTLFVGLLATMLLVTPKGWTFVVSGNEVAVTPGDASVERGSSLVVLVRFKGKVPAEAALVVDSANDSQRRIPLAKNLDDPVFGGAIPEIKSDAGYYVEFGSERTARFKVSVFDYPELKRSDANLTFPEYTGLSAKRIEDTRRVSAVEGTKVDFTFEMNKPLKSAALVARDKTTVPLVPDPTRSNVYSMNLTLEENKSFELRLVDADGRTNKMPADIVMDVLPNRAPELKIAFPRQDMRVSPIEELRFQATASDDFGLKGYGLAYTMAGHETKFVSLGQTAGSNEKKEFSHLVALEDLSAKPDELITYYVWADDLGADGQVRRTASDMFFAEVRHFEEIFREGQQQAGGASQQQQGQRSQSERLAELQKQIINATWNLQRKEIRSKPSAGYKKDVSVVRQSQKQALDQAKELQANSENPQVKPMVDSVVKEMEKALSHLAEATDQNSVKPLPPAVAAEQAAYQALLKLQAREFQVSRGQRGGGGGGGGGGRMQQQLDQLDLKQSENRYETQRQASLQNQAPEQREQLQFLNRLKELARRQSDLNRRLQELQTALQEAKTEAEREAVRRQLKRLREEEQEMLDDVDELRQRMDRAQNQSQVAEARQQLDQTRNDIRRTGQELEKEAVSQALASGTRAQRDLQQLQEDFRKKTSNEFAEDMRQMRTEARQLAQREEELAKKMEDISSARRKTLSDTSERNQLAEQLAQQKSSMTNLLNNVRRVTEQSEAAEPLLSKQLYDTYRRTDQAKANQALDMAGELLRRGFVPQATEAEKPARPVLNQLKQGVERAAESVLGDESEALRLARNELDDLTRQIEDEMAQANRQGGQTPGQPGQNSNPSDSQSANRRNQRGSQGGQPADQNQGQAGEPNNQQQASSESGSQQDQLAQNSQGQRGGQQGERASQSQRSEQGQRGSQGQRGQGQGQPGQSDSSQQASANQGQTGQGNQGQDGQQGQQGQRGQGGRGRGEGQGGAGQRQALTAGEPNRQGNPGQRGGARTGGGAGGGGGGEQTDDVLRQFGGWTGPLTGAEYTQWSDRLRNVEEMVDIPDLRNQLAQVLDRARGIRADVKRHSKDPQWDLVKAEIVTPLVEVRQRIVEVLARLESSDPLVPIDRDPVPKKYSDLVRRYYETLGKSE